ncbi:MAG TPA: selenocysteine-specific translation elongation factor [Ktedonobacterales bacterium]|nr:selenocysteine-specific translation elongation factor [Ktedonobacterales bacterium]
MSCIGTAGHVDHGKSTLVTALTGIDPDRLAEEKARGMTIDLGFAWVTLPSGREASIVDVPGHESFIRNMLAGVGGIDVALLVIAADEGVMPQTDEHLAILDMLRVRSGVVALTKCDLVDDEWLALVREDIAERLAPTTLASSPIIPCSSVTRQGLPELLAALDQAVDAAPMRRDLGRPRLPVDRVFSMAGFGTVVTGTLQEGSLHIGQEVEVQPRGLRARIRGLQAHRHPIDDAEPGGRLAVNLTGTARADLGRGDVVTLPGMFQPTTALDVRLDLLASAPRALAHNAEVEVYLGAAEVQARVALFEDDELETGATGWAQIRMAQPLVAARGDRFIVRIPSPSLTIGGGVVVDPHPRRYRRHNAAVLGWLATLADGAPEDIVLAMLRGQPGIARSSSMQVARLGYYGGRELADLARLVSMPTLDVETALSALVERGDAVSAGSLYFAADQWRRLSDDALQLVREYHRRYPLRAGIPREEWRSRLRLTPREAAEAQARMVSIGTLAETHGGRGVFVCAPGHVPQLTPQQQQAVDALLARFHHEPFAPPTRPEVEETLGAEVTALLVEQGVLVRLNDAVLLERSAYVEALRRMVEHLRTHESLTVADARDLLGTTRKYMLALFEHTDERRYTVRRGDDRILGPQAPEVDLLAQNQREDDDT